MKVVVTDAYSTSNLGDDELVAQTVEYARGLGPEAITVMAIDPDSFRRDARYSLVRFISVPLSRERWHALIGAARYAWLLRELFALCLSLVVASAPVPAPARRWALRQLASGLRVPWLLALAEANRTIAVGGGYLGDRYLRGSCVALVLYRVSVALGCSVETMPLSISSARHPVLRLMLFRFGSGVQWRSREATTHAILSAHHASSTIVPDLAWLNAVREGSASRGFDPIRRVIVAPVGAAFYVGTRDRPPASWQTVLEMLRRETEVKHVALVPMHTVTPALVGDGGDERACEAIAGLVAESFPDVTVTIERPSTYAGLCELMREADLAICERLHAALAALTQGTFALVVGYEPKHRGVLAVAGLEELVVNASEPSPLYRVGPADLIAAAHGQAEQVRIGLRARR